MIVSVVVPAFNVENYIADCVESIICQSYPEFELIIVENGSTDGTIEVINKYSDPRLSIMTCGAFGVSFARNEGLKRAKGNAVLFLDADDWLHPTALSRLVEGLVSSPSSVGVFGSYKFTDVFGDIWQHSDPLPSFYNGTNIDFLNCLAAYNPFGNGGHVLIRRSALDKTEGFPIGIHFGEDWVLWCELACLGAFKCIDMRSEVLYFRQREGSAFRKLALDIRNFELCINMIYSRALVKSVLGDKVEKYKRVADASSLWTVGRENFRQHRTKYAIRFMLKSVLKSFSFRRAFLMAVVILSPKLAGKVSRELTVYNFKPKKP